MDFTSALKPDVYRAIVVVLIPGFIAVSPWCFGVFWPEVAYSENWSDRSLPIISIMLLLSMAGGLLLENIGSRLESAIDRKLSVSMDGFEGRWTAYLETPSMPELVAHRYLRALITRYKFELSMVPALLMCAVGLGAAYYSSHLFSGRQAASLIGFCLLTMSWLYGELALSAQLLHSVRKIIVDASR